MKFKIIRGILIMTCVSMCLTGCSNKTIDSIPIQESTQIVSESQIEQTEQTTEPVTEQNIELNLEQNTEQETSIEQETEKNVVLSGMKIEDALESIIQSSRNYHTPDKIDRSDDLYMFIENKAQELIDQYNGLIGVVEVEETTIEISTSTEISTKEDTIENLANNQQNYILTVEECNAVQKTLNTEITIAADLLRVLQEKEFSESEINSMYKNQFSQVDLWDLQLKEIKSFDTTVDGISKLFKKQMHYNEITDLLVKYSGTYDESKPSDKKLKDIRDFYSECLDILLENIESLE